MNDTENWIAGAEVARIRSAPISRTTLALYAGASGDHNPIHIDLDAARRAGMDDVIGHGMLAMAQLARAATTAAPQHELKTIKTRFAAPIVIGDELTCVATVSELYQAGQMPMARLGLTASNQAGQVKLIGEALVARPEKQR